jgi:uncharacterized membrane protein
VRPTRASLRRSLLTGMLVLAPAAITGWVFLTVLRAIDGWLRPLLKSVPRLGSRIPESGFTGIGLLAAVLLVMLVGYLASKGLGRAAIAAFDRLVSRIPLIKAIYVSIRELSTLLLAEKRSAFRKVVLFEYPRPGLYSVGFVTNELQGARSEAFVNVFLPTTPNPTTGFLLILPRADIVELALTAEDGLKLVMSGGAVVSDAGRDRLGEAVSRLRAAP